MKKLYFILILSLLLTTTSFAGVKKGKGDVILEENTLKHFIKYIRGKRGKHPIGFILSSDGSWSTYWFCPERDACGGMNYDPTIKECEDSTGVECGLFARRYTILWKNGINPGKGKESRIKKKWSDEEIIAKLTELGFLDNNNSSTSTTSKKIKSKKYVDGITYFNRCSTSSDKEEYHDSFEVDLKKKTIKQEFFATGEIYKSKKKIILNNNDIIKTKIEKYGNDYAQYIFNKKNDEITTLYYKDKKGKVKDGQHVLMCDEIVGTLNNQKVEKKITKKYELKGERSIALSWDGYENLIAGTVEFDEADYKGTLKIPLPNNDGTCDGSYSLQEGGKGTWQIACTNNMGAAGTLKWTETGGVTGKGRDHNDKKVKFTVSKKS
tara:strand:+ start:121 stop:1260 length:1140 start_codon:yes stop_codon:yes gene_type:complete